MTGNDLRAGNDQDALTGQHRVEAALGGSWAAAAGRKAKPDVRGPARQWA